MDLMSGGMRSYGEFGLVPAKYQDAIRMGLGFFECRLRLKHRWGQSVQGPFDVEVSEVEGQVSDQNGEPKYQVNWLTDARRPAVRFQPANTKSEISVAFIVDDPGWYNRVLIADPLNQAFIVVAYHSNKGVIPAAAIQPWFECLRERLWTKVPMYNVIGNNGVMIENFRDKKTAEEFKDAKDDNNGKLLRPRSWIAETTVFDKTDEVRRLIAENRGIEYGWTASAEFRSRIRPEIERAIKEKLGDTEEHSFTVPRTLSDIKAMSAEDRKALRELILGEDKIEPERVAPKGKRLNLRDKSKWPVKEVLIEYAKKIGVTTLELLNTKNEVIEAITVAQNGDCSMYIENVQEVPEPEPEQPVIT